MVYVLFIYSQKKKKKTNTSSLDTPQYLLYIGHALLIWLWRLFKGNA